MRIVGNGRGVRGVRVARRIGWARRIRIVLVDECANPIQLRLGNPILLNQMGDQWGYRPAGQPIGQRFQLLAGVIFARNGRLKKVNGQSPIARDETLLFETLQQPLDRSVLGSRCVRIKSLTDLSGGHRIGLIPQQFHDGEFGIGQFGQHVSVCRCGLGGKNFAVNEKTIVIAAKRFGPLRRKCTG